MRRAGLLEIGIAEESSAADPTFRLLISQMKPLLTVFVIVLLTAPLSCSRGKQDLTAYSKMRNIWIAIRDFEEITGHIPEPNGNTWSFSETTKYDTVPWRGLLLARSVSIPPPGKRSATQGYLENLIESAATDMFIIGGRLVYSNLENIDGHSLRELPSYQVLALTVVTPTTPSWNDAESEDVMAIVDGRESLSIPPEGCYLLFANGNVGKLAYNDRFALKQLLRPLPDASAFTRRKLADVGVEILEPSRADFRTDERGHD